MIRLALRNLVRNARRSLITAAAITFGLGMMIVAANLSRGQWDGIIDQGIGAYAGHVVVQDPGYDADPQQYMREGSAHLAVVEATFPEALVTPRVELSGLLSSPANSVGVHLRAADPAREKQVDTLHERVVEGTWLDGSHPRGVVIGSALADALDVDLGDKVVFMTGAGDDVRSELLRVRGVMHTGAPEYDGFYAFAPLAIGQKLLDTPGGLHRIAVHLDTARGSDLAAAKLSIAGVEVLTWEAAVPDLVAMAQLKRQGGDVALLALMIVVALGIVNTMLMSVLERQKEFGVLLAIGMHPRSLARLVVVEALLLGVLGVTAALIWSIPASAYMVSFGLDMSSKLGETTELGGLPVDTTFFAAWDVTRIVSYCIATLGFAVGSAIYPAFWVLRLSPVDAMRS